MAKNTQEELQEVVNYEPPLKKDIEQQRHRDCIGICGTTTKAATTARTEQITTTTASTTTTTASTTTTTEPTTTTTASTTTTTEPTTTTTEPTTTTTASTTTTTEPTTTTTEPTTTTTEPATTTTASKTTTIDTSTAAATTKAASTTTTTASTTTTTEPTTTTTEPTTTTTESTTTTTEPTTTTTETTTTTTSQLASASTTSGSPTSETPETAPPTSKGLTTTRRATTIGANNTTPVAVITSVSPAAVSTPPAIEATGSTTSSPNGAAGIAVVSILPAVLLAFGIMALLLLLLYCRQKSKGRNQVAAADVGAPQAPDNGLAVITRKRNPVFTDELPAADSSTDSSENKYLTSTDNAAAYYAAAHPEGHTYLVPAEDDSTYQVTSAKNADVAYKSQDTSAHRYESPQTARDADNAAAYSTLTTHSIYSRSPLSPDSEYYTVDGDVGTTADYHFASDTKEPVYALGTSTDTDVTGFDDVRYDLGNADPKEDVYGQVGFTA